MTTTITATININDSAKEYSQETKEFIAYLEDRNYALDDIHEFIAEHGEYRFFKYYEEYVEYGEKHDYAAVDAFIKTFGIVDIEHFEDAYRGHYPNFRDFAEEVFEDLWSYQIPQEIEHYFDMDSYERDLRYEFYHVDEYVFQDY